MNVTPYLSDTFGTSVRLTTSLIPCETHPLLSFYETVIWGGALDGHVERAMTVEGAERLHTDARRMVIGALSGAP